MAASLLYPYFTPQPPCLSTPPQSCDFLTILRQLVFSSAKLPPLLFRLSNPLGLSPADGKPFMAASLLCPYFTPKPPCLSTPPQSGVFYSRSRTIR